jgi:hypothetical protein
MKLSRANWVRKDSLSDKKIYTSLVYAFRRRMTFIKKTT